MIGIFTEHNLREFEYTFGRYWRIFRGNRKEALARAARNFSFFAVKRLKDRQIPKGAITQERLQGFKSGEGLKISDRAKQLVAARYGITSNIKSRRQYITRMTRTQAKEIERINKATGGRITLQALLAQQELRLREGHRAFATSAARFRTAMIGQAYSTAKIKSQKLGVSELKDGGAEADKFEFEWGNMLGKFGGLAAKSLTSAPARNALNRALVDTKKDMTVYIDRKHAEAARRAASTFRRL